MKLSHRAPAGAGLRSDAIGAAYQAEVDRTMARTESAWNRAQKRLRAAERRLEKAEAVPVAVESRAAAIAKAEALVEQRRVELEQIHRLMVATGFPSTARGRKSFRPIPAPTTPL